MKASTSTYAAKSRTKKPLQSSCTVPPASLEKGNDLDKPSVSGGRFDYDDGGTYCGHWANSQAHGYGVCTGPKGHGEFSGLWISGFEQSGVYLWKSDGEASYAGSWANGKRNGLGVERKEHWVFRGEWTNGLKGRLGIRQSTVSDARYEGSWTSGLQNGLGVETYCDGGSYSGQWRAGVREGLGERQSAAAEQTVVVNNSQVRGGFVLNASKPMPRRRKQSEAVSKEQKSKMFLGFIGRQYSDGHLFRRKKVKRQTSMFDAAAAANLGQLGSRHSERLANVGTGRRRAGTKKVSLEANGIEKMRPTTKLTECYVGEWLRDKRTGLGICQRSDGLCYEGEWQENAKNGYGRTTFPDGSYEEGFYRNNELQPQKAKQIVGFRTQKLSDIIRDIVIAARQTAEVTRARSHEAEECSKSAREKAELALYEAERAEENSRSARKWARFYAPEFQQPGDPDQGDETPPLPRLEESSTAYDQIFASATRPFRSAHLTQAAAIKRRLTAYTRASMHQPSNKSRDSPYNSRQTAEVYWLATPHCPSSAKALALANDLSEFIGSQALRNANNCKNDLISRKKHNNKTSLDDEEDMPSAAEKGALLLRILAKHSRNMESTPHLSTTLKRSRSSPDLKRTWKQLDLTDCLARESYARQLQRNMPRDVTTTNFAKTIAVILDWCYQHNLVLVIVALNIVLAAVLVHFLTPSRLYY